MKAFLIDTNILVDFLRGKQRANNFMNQLEIQPIISSLTVAELFAGVKGKKERVSLHNLINACEVIPITTEIAEEGGLIKNKYQKSHHIGLADALIGATAIEADLTLATLNKKHFPMLKKINVLYS
ncbi:MAG: type II toxin-antitoxin system VapC family toxin [Candidatus Marinimicrobia bacterium]|nr:type II toxin-antitoxin system VapC family toxin [Candidatus Neomarinimicrobiota bacterium]